MNKRKRSNSSESSSSSESEDKSSISLPSHLNSLKSDSSRDLKRYKWKYAPVY